MLHQSTKFISISCQSSFSAMGLFSQTLEFMYFYSGTGFVHEAYFWQGCSEAAELISCSLNSVTRNRQTQFLCGPCHSSLFVHVSVPNNRPYCPTKARTHVMLSNGKYVIYIFTKPFISMNKCRLEITFLSFTFLIDFFLFPTIFTYCLTQTSNFSQIALFLYFLISYFVAVPLLT